MVDEIKNTSKGADRFKLFAPIDGRDLRDTYPTIASDPVFENLSKENLDFVWLWANTTSPHAAISDKYKKAKACFDTAFGSDYKNSTLRKIYESLDFPEEIKTAIDKMRTYNLDVRSRAYKVYIDNFDSILKIKEKLEKMVDMAEEVKELKDAISAISEINETIQPLVMKIESETGITEKVKRKKEEVDTSTYLDKVKRQKEQ